MYSTRSTRDTLPPNQVVGLPLNYIKAGIPPHGNVRVLCVTDIQWANSLKFIDKKQQKTDEQPGLLTLFDDDE